VDHGIPCAPQGRFAFLLHCAHVKKLALRFGEAQIGKQMFLVIELRPADGQSI